MIAVPTGNGLRPLALRVSVTDRCQLHCKYCRPPDGVALRPHADATLRSGDSSTPCVAGFAEQGAPSLRSTSIMRYEEIAAFVRILNRMTSLVKVRLTGGEPLVRSGIERLVDLLAQLNIPDIALTTNGQLLAGFAASLKSAGLARVNVSLDTLNERTYRELSRGGVLGRTLEGIGEALRCGLFPLKVNMVVLRGVNDSEILDMVEFAAELGAEIRFLEVMPIGAARKYYREWFFSSADVKSAIQTRYCLKPVPREPGSTCHSFLVENSAGSTLGRAGFISACSEPFCHDCNRLRLTSDGRLLTCLASDDSGVTVRTLLSSGAEGLQQLEQVLENILAHKSCLRRDKTCQAAGMTCQVYQAEGTAIGMAEDTIYQTEGLKMRSAFRQSRLMAAIGG